MTVGQDGRAYITILYSKSLQICPHKEAVSLGPDKDRVIDRGDHCIILLYITVLYVSSIFCLLNFII